MQRAKAMGIDAFALNIGTDDYTDKQLGYAYEAAVNNDFKVFISFDFAWYQAGSAAVQVGQKIATFASEAGQLKIGGKTVASSFMGEALDVASMRSAAGLDVFWAPNYSPGGASAATVDAALSWLVRCSSSGVGAHCEDAKLTARRLGQTTVPTQRQLLETTILSSTTIRCILHGWTAGRTLLVSCLSSCTASCFHTNKT